jgi:serine/threonine-protein kinase RsbW
MTNIKVQIPSLPENIRIVESFIDNAKDKFKISEDMYGNIMVAVTESVNNAILHGNKGDKNKNVHLSLSMNEKEITFIVEDEGTGFDFENLADPTAPENITKPGGRGIFLMQALCDKVSFEKNGSVVEMTFQMN